MNYNDVILDTAYTVFLNFYKAKTDNILLSNEDAQDLIMIISDQYNYDHISVETDISNEIKRIIKRIPKTYLAEATYTIH